MQLNKSIIKFIRGSTMMSLSKAILSTAVLSALFLPTAKATPMWAEGACQDNVNQGANRSYYNSGVAFKWDSYLGDWIDQDGNLYGTNAYDSLQIQDKDQAQVLNLDLTKLVDGWHKGDFANQGVMLKNRTGSKVTVYSREHSDASLTPKLEVSTTAGTFYLSPAADTMLRSSTYYCAGELTSLNTTGPILLQFETKQLPKDADVISAKLTLHTTENQYGNAQLDAFRVTIPEQKYSGASLAQAYPNDFEMKYDDQVYLVETFDKAGWESNWTYVWGQENMEVVTENVQDKFEPLMGSALQVTIPEGNLSGINMGYLFEDKLGHDVEEVYFRYYIRLGDTWKTNDTGKLPGIAGTYAGTPHEGGWGGRSSNGTNGWSARGMFTLELQGNNPFSGQVPIGNYIYHKNQSNAYGDHIIYDGKRPGVIEKNKWHSIEQQVKMNTPGKKDGIFRAWIDGELAYENTELEFRDVNSAFIAIDRIWVNFYHGGIKPINQTSNAYIDNLVVASQYIGPISESQNVALAGTEEGRPPVITAQHPIESDVQATVNETTSFSIEYVDPDSNNLDVNWYLNGELVESNTDNFDFYRGIADANETTVSVEVVDEEGKIATHFWLLSDESQNWSIITATDDTTIAEYTNSSLGLEESVKVNTQAVTMMKFTLPETVNPFEVQSATLIFTDYVQYGNMEIEVYVGPNDWNEGTDSVSGASRHFKDYGSSTRWMAVGSDWIDATGTLAGDVPFATQFIADLDKAQKIEIDVTDVVYASGENEVTIILKANGGNHAIASKEHPIESYKPKLVIQN